jgi:hypothetical protein
MIPCSCGHEVSEHAGQKACLRKGCKCKKYFALCPVCKNEPKGHCGECGANDGLDVFFTARDEGFSHSHQYMNKRT